MICNGVLLSHCSKFIPAGHSKVQLRKKMREHFKNDWKLWKPFSLNILTHWNLHLLNVFSINVGMLRPECWNKKSPASCFNSLKDRVCFSPAIWSLTGLFRYCCTWAGWLVQSTCKESDHFFTTKLWWFDLKRLSRQIFLAQRWRVFNGGRYVINFPETNTKPDECTINCLILRRFWHLLIARHVMVETIWLTLDFCSSLTVIGGVL